MVKVNKIVMDKDGFLREDKSNKVDYTLIPVECLRELAFHFTEGAIIHGVDNWKKCKDVDSFKKSAFRHFISILRDKDDEDHYSALIWNIMALQYNKLKDDL